MKEGGVLLGCLLRTFPPRSGHSDGDAVILSAAKNLALIGIRPRFFALKITRMICLPKILPHTILRTN